MFRNVARPLTTVPRSAAPRSFSALAPRMGEGDTGAPKQGGAAQGDSDAFTKREAAQESLYIHEKEIEKLHALKKKLGEQRSHLDELEKHVDQLTKSKGQQ